VLSLLDKNIIDINWKELERIKGLSEKKNNTELYEKFIDCVSKKKEVNICKNETIGKVKVTFNYDKEIKKKEVKDFVAYYNKRFKSIETLLKNRQELFGLTSIARVNTKTDREKVSIIGIVKDRSVTHNGHVMLTLEDPTGTIKVLVSNKSEHLETAKNIVHDEVIAINGSTGDKIVFAGNIVFPNVPLHKELKKSPLEEYAMFLSDLHVGSNHFLKEKFEKFIKWLNGEGGTEEHKRIAKKLKYIFIIGDIVAGVGIYPGQEEELTIKDVCVQYEECAKYLNQIPKHITLIICPGNHDSVRISEPQPAFDRTFAEPIFKLDNAILLSNPGHVNIGGTENFPGFDVLLYHGYSFDYFISNVDSIRNNGGYNRADLVMTFLLQRRHLAPTHTSTPYIPDKSFDPLFIKKVPDFFVSGHIHKSCVASYRNVSLICGSCWESTTPFQEKVGHVPEPAQVPIVNLKTRKTKILRF